MVYPFININPESTYELRGYFKGKHEEVELVAIPVELSPEIWENALFVEDKDGFQMLGNRLLLPETVCYSLDGFDQLERITVQKDLGRSATVLDKTYVLDLGIWREELTGQKQEFVENVKGSGTTLENSGVKIKKYRRNARKFSQERDLENILNMVENIDESSAVFIGSISHGDSPKGAQSTYDFDRVTNGLIGGRIKTPPVVYGIEFPESIVDIVKKSTKNILQYMIEDVMSINFKNKYVTNFIKGLWTLGFLLPFQLPFTKINVIGLPFVLLFLKINGYARKGFGQEKRLLPSLVRAQYFDYGSDHKIVELSRLISKNPSELEQTIDYVFQDAGEFMMTLSEEAKFNDQKLKKGKYSSLIIGDAYENVKLSIRNLMIQYLRRFDGYTYNSYLKRSRGWYINKDLVIAQSGAWFIDHESLYTENFRTYTEFRRCQEIQIVTILRDFTSVLTNLVVGLEIMSGSYVDNDRRDGIGNEVLDKLYQHISAMENISVSEEEGNVSITINYPNIDKEDTYLFQRESFLPIPRK